MAFRKTHKWLVSIFFGCAALILFCLNCLLIWVVTGPRSLNAITPYIQSAVIPPGSPYHVKIESSELVWDGWTHPIGIHVKNVVVTNDKNLEIATFPEIGVRLRFFQLLAGKIDLKSLEFIRPTILLVQSDDGKVFFGFNYAAAPAAGAVTDGTAGDDSHSPPLLTLFTDEQNDNILSHLSSLIVRNATLSIKKEHSGVFLKSPDASLELTRNKGLSKGVLSIPFVFDNHSGQIETDFTLNQKDKTVISEVIYTDVPSAVLQALFPTQKWMNAAQMPFSGWANIKSNFDTVIDSIEFMSEAGPGTIEYPEQFKKPIDLQRLHVEGKLSNKFTTLDITKGTLDLKGFAFKFSGTAVKQGDDYGVNAHVETQQAPVDSIDNYWPTGLAPQTRAWVIGHISKGSIPKAVVDLRFKPGDFKLKDIPKEDIDATINVKGTTVQYMPKHPPVTDVNGEIKFTGESMYAKVTHANYMTGSQVSSADVSFPDFSPADVRLFLDMNILAPAKDVATFLALPDLDKAKRLNLTSAITGTAHGNAKVDFIAFSDDERKNASAGHINYNVSADLVDVSQPQFMNKYDVANANMNIKLNNKGVKAVGKASVDTLPMALNIYTSFAQDNETTYDVKTEMPVTKLAEFGLPKFDFAKGILGVDASFVSSDTTDKSVVSLDLTGVSLDITEHKFSKKLGDKASLKFSTEKLSSGNTRINDFVLTSPNYTMSGNAEYSRALNDFTALTFSTLRWGNDDLTSLDYAKTPQGIKLTAKGRSFDASPYIQKTRNNNSYQAYNLNFNVDRLVLGENRVLNNLSAIADCGAQCRVVNISAKLPSGTPFNYVISDGKLTSSCDNAGELLRSLAIFDGIDGGKMVIEGGYKGNDLVGRVLMTDFTLKKAPVLTKIITVASLSGILDTLSGNGIFFSKLVAPFSYGHDVFVLKEAKAHGSALGVTTDGVVDLHNSNLDLNGTLVPSYTLNSLVGNIPLIGDLLVGGTGKGIIAINYSVSGEMSDPSIKINPLSAFTPGFMRNVFDIFDAPAPDLDKIIAARKAAEDKAAATTSAAPAAPATTAAPATPAANTSPPTTSKLPPPPTN